jgi:ElaB/YqjD/DUF883 family membrane-anchored ribosome-binding protein
MHISWKPPFGISGVSAMLTADPSSVVQKRDLHVGGLGSSASGALAAVSDRLPEVSQGWLRAARNAARDADDYVREQPWAALAVVAVLGMAAGYLISRRTS